MPIISWNDIRSNAVEFSQEYKDATRENAETQSFYNDFFKVFGVTRRRVASYEAPVKKLGAKHGRIDLFWKRTLLVEQKSAGKDLEVAYTQALDYFPNLTEEELPRYILVCDFQNFELYDLDTDTVHKFKLEELHTKVELFGFIAGYQKREFKDQDPVNIKASELMGKLHDMLKATGYSGHDLEQYLVRLLFCLFADDTGIFDKDTLSFYIEEQTREDGSDLGMHLNSLFATLNKPYETRQTNLSEALKAFPYINGNLFAERLEPPAFDRAMRETLITACYFDWGSISPAIFGSLFQSVMDKDKRRGMGAHYTTEKNIMKILKPLFLDALYAEFESVRYESKKLQNFHKKLETLTFLDPACGCGNFLILAYRELRLLEIEVLKALNPDNDKALEKQLKLDVSQFSSRINVDAFYGIEIEEFPARIAEVAMWLIDHQMNLRLSEAFGQYYARIPLKKSAHIHNANALKLDWNTVISKEQLSYILGNPPFVGKHLMSLEQGKEIDILFHGVNGAGVLDYVTAWYLKAAQYIQDSRIVCGFVSTNSISQGEQTAILWQELFNRYHIKIHFAHRTFAWSSEAKGKAAVYCVIVGFAVYDIDTKLLYDYDTPKSEAHELKVKNINPYLIEGDDFVIDKRRSPICNIPSMLYGNKPVDGGNLILSDAEKEELLSKEPLALKWIRPFITAEEFINGKTRWCLWLVGIQPNELHQLPEVMKRVKLVKETRSNSVDEGARKLASRPAEFRDTKVFKKYMIFPLHSSEIRQYIPFGYIDFDCIVGNSCSFIPNPDLFQFGVLTSQMHMAWMRTVCGRIKSDYRYSNTIVYNNFPFPQNPTPEQVKDIEKKAQAVLDTRALFPTSTLADLYDPLTMPPALVKAHRVLDKAVDTAYRKPPFDTELQRVEYLFNMYKTITEPLLTAIAESNKKKRQPKN
ncbi:MAG: class I SAM-dependent DNA methyltransferase [Chloroflexi bacterium]|uniref:site-specific DNA-methyltransferase (adenine-specific) n=1 Tax=Candidatus Chlorohelix allophototropha TaxID=3003348 RepID=A0A8T7LWZ0_9CHLR|nr:class I SAM-dependent DNA methyltransferase [Chloroflexota bacterium]WJW65877.1 hypothetical protein OZ401_001656 [Chloroflexota bacterium L227-S17]